LLYFYFYGTIENDRSLCVIHKYISIIKFLKEEKAMRKWWKKREPAPSPAPPKAEAIKAITPVAIGRLLVLQILSKGKKNTFQLADVMTGTNSFPCDMSTLYISLFGLKDRGYITSELGETADQKPVWWHTITESGRAYLAELFENYQKPIASVNAILEAYSD